MKEKREGDVIKIGTEWCVLYNNYTEPSIKLNNMILSKFARGGSLVEKDDTREVLFNLLDLVDEALRKAGKK